ncbi:unnamed protein product [Gordionus sp. m RMFG-2023]|uniref:cytosolic non-specific dipeptidase-like n=1 Tax=Gordionus sp. m RMFG-2023 TaxID=3053472 RepID=UPI0030E02F68
MIITFWIWLLLFLTKLSYSSHEPIDKDSAKNCKYLDETHLENFFKAIDYRKDFFIERLAQAVDIPSVSSQSESQGDLLYMLEWAGDILKNLGFSWQIKIPTLSNNSKYRSSLKYPFLFGHLPIAQKIREQTLNKSKTLLIYGHVDVVAAKYSDGWEQSDPFVLERKNGFLKGRGTTDDKGPVVAWLNALSVLKEELGNDCFPPLNIKIFLETGEEIGSPGLRKILSNEATFFNDIDYLVVTDNSWLTNHKPCLTYGLRGMVYFSLEIKGPFNQDLHSGIYGGPVDEPLQESVYLLASLVDKDGKILIPEIYDDVLPLEEPENASYSSIQFNDKNPGAYYVASKNEVLAKKWRWPSLSIHGVEGSVSQKGDVKTVIPHRILSKFSIRLVPDQDPERVKALVRTYLEELHANWTMGKEDTNTMTLESLHEGIQAWYNPNPQNNPVFIIAEKAVKRVYGLKPDYTREGGTIPAVVYLSQAVPSPTNVILLPIGTADDGAHSQNEKISEQHFMNGTKLMLAYIYELSLTQY